MRKVGCRPTTTFPSIPRLAFNSGTAATPGASGIAPSGRLVLISFGMPLILVMSPATERVYLISTSVSVVMYMNRAAGLLGFETTRLHTSPTLIWPVAVILTNLFWKKSLIGIGILIDFWQPFPLNGVYGIAGRASAFPNSNRKPSSVLALANSDRAGRDMEAPSVSRSDTISFRYAEVTVPLLRISVDIIRTYFYLCDLLVQSKMTRYGTLFSIYAYIVKQPY
ncbi:protein of unknown function [Candidatus Methylocalor cossyra]|uniref:Uncharacterized protein n=1 Tax=Candidatus Methylocalor cossyra TaxID=3108543 RepID=A0ABP1C9Q3_9GAMM